MGVFGLQGFHPPLIRSIWETFFRFVANKKVDGLVELFRYKHLRVLDLQLYFHKEKWKEVHNFESYSQGGARIEIALWQRGGGEYYLVFFTTKKNATNNKACTNKHCNITSKIIFSDTYHS